jgi:hypothetical protein
MNRKAFIAAVVIFAFLAISIGVAYIFANQAHVSPEVSPTPIVTQTPTPNASPAAEIKPLNPQYLPFFYENATSKIFLESATPRYGNWTNSDTPMTWFNNGPVIHTGDPVFVVNLTVRNDYTLNDQTRVNSLNFSTVILYVTLYDANNSVISAPQAYPKVDSNYYTSNQWSFDSGKSSSFELYFLTADRNVDHYQISVALVSSMPPP